MTQLDNKKKLKLTTPDLVVLSLLCESAMHGYDINQELIRREVQDWAGVSRPQVYYSLNKLKLLQMIAEIKDKGQAEGPDRQIYQITEKGRRELEKSLNDISWATHRPISPFLTWLALSPNTNNQAIINVINERRKFLKTEIEREKITFKSFKSEEGKMILPGILMVELTIKQFEIELVWLNKVENKLLNK